MRLRRLNGQLTPGLRPLQPQVDASATIATDTVGDEPSEVPLTAGVVVEFHPPQAEMQLPLMLLMVTLVARLQLPYLLLMP